MVVKLRISEAMNTYNPALYVLQARGYTVRMQYDEQTKDTTWIAIKDDARFAASNPLSLLGLVAMWEGRGDRWQKHSDEPDAYTELLGDDLDGGTSDVR